jgi:hypothetical protein
MRGMQHALASERRTPAPVHTDTRAAFALRVLMLKRGYSEQGLADAMLLAGIENAPARSTIARIVREGGVPHRRHQRALAEFFYGPEADPTRIWKMARS